MSKFKELRALNVNERVELKDKERAKQKKEQRYLSWSFAWDIFKQHCPDATYEVVKNPATNLPYFESRAGAMCYTRVTACGETHEMWLPVMNESNKAMKSEPYSYKTKFGEKRVEAFDMFDVNKTIMRCLTKNLAMFGLGIYLFAGEDLPDSDEQTKVEATDIYSDSEFMLAEEKYKGIVNDGARTAEQLIIFLESKNKKLTDEQKSIINSWGVK